ncbi:DUF3015 domain-containing protein [Derxia gummosa]|uniref:DUF3015 domain-containing protein n=1 Tax=Derxia gummosa DSM 723 TaxID=1121388 RepID=A0A8B6X654_9BURK|nr:DUF3015 domain-containing protein [Derxia gummosa]
MKKMLCAAAICLLPFAAAHADPDIGCGLGTQLFKGQSGLAAKVLGATTNGTFGNQTFGISSGTLGCGKDGVVTADARRSMFAGANLDQLAAEMAAGEGEALDTLASLYNVGAADRAAFNALAQREYAAIFSRSDVTTADVLAGLDRALARDARLARYVA